LFFCIKNSPDENENQKMKDLIETENLDENVNNILPKKQKKMSKNSRLKSQLNTFNFLFKSKIRYFFMILFGAYFIFNVTVCNFKFSVQVPMLDVIPKDSYMRKHMINHLELFDLAPIIQISFMKPIEYWNANEFKRIRSFLSDAKLVKVIIDNIYLKYINLIKDFI
jgi:hypothetical protein